MQNLWPNETHPGYGDKRAAAPAWLPEEHADRWERLRHLHALFSGKHQCYFLQEGRTNFNYPQEEIQGVIRRPYHTFNLLKLMSVKTADLLFGAKSRLTASNQAQTDRLDLLARNSLLHSRYHGTIVRASWAGGTFIESLIWRGEPYIENVEPPTMYPLGPLMPDGQYERYVRYATAQIGTGEKAYTILLQTEYRAGVIIRQLNRLTDEGKLGDRLALREWPGFRDAVPADSQATGLDRNTITYVANEVAGTVEATDYDGLIGLQDTINAKIAQIARVIAKHADPKLAMPAQSAKKDGNVRSTQSLFYYRDKSEIPQYIVWTAELEAADRDVKRSIDNFCIASETSQVLLGIKEGAAPTAAKTLALESTNSLAKVGRKALLIEPAIARSIEIVQQLDNRTSLRRSYPVGPIGVEMRDGLPVDDKDEAETISTLRGAGVMSLEAAVERRIEDPDAAAEEVARIRKEQAAAADAMSLMSAPTDSSQNNDDQQQEAA